MYKNWSLNTCFKDIEESMVRELDKLMEEGAGDFHYRLLFKEIMGEKCERHMTMKESGTAFVEFISNLMKLLLDYREVSDLFGIISDTCFPRASSAEIE